jgi:polar amino acid transport system permease protein
MEFGIYLREIPKALLLSAELTLGSLGVGLFIGLFVALMRIGTIRPLRWLASSYIEVVRGVPLFVQILYIYYGIGYLIRDYFHPSPLTSAIAAFGICYGAYTAEVFRAGFQSVERAQMEAARALGLSRGQALRYVILPQAIRNVLPALGNEGIALLKDTSLASAVTLPELTMTGRTIQSITYKPFEVWTVVAISYLSLTVPLSLLVRAMEQRLHVQGTRHTD